MICFPLDNTPYEAKDMGTYLATRTRGVFSSDGNLAVTPGESGLSVSVSPGLAWLKWSDYWGTAALQEQALTLDLDTADGALKRIDAIVCRLDKVNNRAEIVVKKGAPSSAPIVVPPVRDANYDELYIATVLIGAGVISISASAITDQRLNEEYCGLMRDGVTGIPTASLHAQAQQILTELTDALNAQIVRQSAEFDAWFDDLKGKLGEDPATALQQQVDNLNAAVVGDAFQASGTPVSIAYAGAQRIASITAYGETPQGGTTEAPVALTGISSVTLNDDVTELPIPRPLRRVGDVKDKCITRVKSVYDKRIVIDQNSNINMSGEASIVGTSRRFNVPVEDIPITNDAVIEPVRCNILPARPSGGVSGTYALDAPGISLQNNQSVSQPNINIRVPGCKTLEEIKAWLTDNPLIVHYQSTSYNGTNGLDVCLAEYQTGFVELDGTESNLQFFSDYQTLAIKGITTAGDPSQANAYGVCISSHFALVPPGTSTTLDKVVYGQPQYNQIIIHDTSWNSLETAKAYLAAQKAAGTPVQIVYQLATPETYATDPIDFDNAAGPLTIMTGGELEVRMTELLGTRSPELTAKMDKEVYAQVGNPSELDNDNFLHCVNQRGVSGTISTAGYFIDRWKLVSGTVQITANGLVLNGTISQILENAAGTDVAASASAGTASYDNSTKTFTLTATGQTITWAKLEKGSVATPYVAKGYGAELVECYRYFWISSMQVNIFKTTAGDYFRNTVYFPIAMRTVPSVTILASNGTVSINNVTIDAVKFAGNGGNDTVTSFSASADL